MSGSTCAASPGSSRAAGRPPLPRRAVSRLLQETGGNPLYCRAVLEEAGAGGLGLDDEAVRVPRSLAGTVLVRVGALNPAARQLAGAAAVLGQRCELVTAAALAGLADPLAALGEAAAAGILVEEPGGAAARIGFTHLLVQRALYEDLSPARRHRLHQRAAGLVDQDRALGHRVAAAAGPDDELAGELEAAARASRRHGRAVQAAAWLAQAATSRRAIGACWTRWRSWSPTARSPRPMLWPPGWRPPGRDRGAAGCWARWTSWPAGPPRPRPGWRRHGRPTTRPGRRKKASEPLFFLRRYACSPTGSRRRSNGASGRPGSAPPRLPCATTP